MWFKVTFRNILQGLKRIQLERIALYFDDFIRKLRNDEKKKNMSFRFKARKYNDYLKF